MTATTAADAIAAAFASAGTKRIYGVPGGGSSLDLIAAAKARGIDFVLARHETSAVIMAATEAELAGTPGAALCTRGPGVGNAANGMAHAPSTARRWCCSRMASRRPSAPSPRTSISTTRRCWHR